MRKLHLCAGLVGALALAACGGGRDDDDTNNQADAAPHADAGPQPDAMVQGAPTITAVSAHLSANSTQPTWFEFSGTDPDGNASAARFSFLDASGTPIVLTQGGDTFVDLTPDVPFGTDQTFTRKMKLSAGLFDPSSEQPAVTVRLAIVDADGHVSSTLDAPIEANPTLHNAGGACGSGTDYCDSDFICTANTCEAPAGQQAECDAADAATAITASTSTMVNVTASTGEFEGSCGFQMGKNEAVLKITLAADSHVTVTTDATPSADTLDSYIYIRSACADPSSEQACNDDIDFNGGNYKSALDIQSLAPGSYYVFIDGSFEASDGSATVTGDIGVNITIAANKAAGAACNPTTDSCVAGYSCFDAAGGTNGTCKTPEEIVTAQCGVAPSLNNPAGGSVTGSVRKTGSGFFEGSCGVATGLPEALHKMTLAARTQVTLSTDDPATLFDTLLYINDGACGPTNTEHADACDDDGGVNTSLTSNLVVKLDAGTYTVVVDRGFAPGTDEVDPTPYKLTYSFKPVIGAGLPCNDAVNVCDDGLTCTAGTCQ